MSSPAFLIDGVLEKFALQQLCPGSKINTINCNGNSVVIGAIAKRIATLIRLLNNRHYPIVILIDREDRIETSIQIVEELERQLIELGIKDDLIINVCDRMIENWIIADWEKFCEACCYSAETPSPTDGMNGKSFVKKCYPRYLETTDGVKMLVNARPSVMIEHSISFYQSSEKMKNLRCSWLQAPNNKLF